MQHSIRKYLIKCLNDNSIHCPKRKLSIHKHTHFNFTEVMNYGLTRFMIFAFFSRGIFVVIYGKEGC